MDIMVSVLFGGLLYYVAYGATSYGSWAYQHDYAQAVEREEGYGLGI